MWRSRVWDGRPGRRPNALPRQRLVDHQRVGLGRSGPNPNTNTNTNPNLNPNLNPDPNL